MEGRALMLKLNREQFQRLGLSASLIAVIGLGMSILCGNEEDFVGSVSVAHQKILLMFAAAIALRLLYCVLRNAFKHRKLDSEHECPARSQRNPEHDKRTEVLNVR